MTTNRTPTDLADTIDGATSVLLRWTYEEVKTIRPEEKDMIVAALRAYTQHAADGEQGEKK